MKRRIIFLMVATPVLWLIVVAPLTMLFSWWMPSITTLKSLAWSLIFAPFVSILLWMSFQTSNLILKWPMTQLIGCTTLLMNVIIPCCLLLLFFSAPFVALIVSVSWLLLTVYAIYKAHDIKSTSLSVQSKKISKSYKLMHLSDVHAGSRSRSFLEKIVTQAVQQSPDIVFITGDLLDSSAVDANHLQPLSKFTCPVFLCLGNHERYVNPVSYTHLTLPTIYSV